MSHSSVGTVPGSAVGLAAPSRGRPSWSGLLQVSLLAVPVKAYPAVSSTDTVHFHQLHADCGQRIRYDKRRPVHGSVDAAAIVKGYPYARDQYIVVGADELDQLRPTQDRALRLEQFVEPWQVAPTLFAGRCLYLLPDGLGARRPYAVLAEALRQHGKWALGRVVLSGQRQLAVVRPSGRGLALDVLHYPERLRATPSDTEAGAEPATPEELRLAGLLIDAASGPIDWTQLRDASAAEVRALVEAKVAGRPPVPTTAPTAVLSCLDALRQSVAAVTTPSGGTTPADASPRRKG